MLQHSHSVPHFAQSTLNGWEIGTNLRSLVPAIFHAGSDEFRTAGTDLVLEYLF